MPEIPFYRDRVAPPRVSPQPTRMPRESLRDAGAAGAGLARLGLELRELNDQMEREEQQNKITDLQNRSLRRLKDLEFEMQHGEYTDEDGERRKIESFREAQSVTMVQIERIKNDILAEVDDEVVEEEVRLSFDRTAIGTNARIRTNIAKGLHAEHVDSYNVRRDLLIDEIVSSDSPAQKQTMRQMLLEHIARASSANIIDDPRQQLMAARNTLAKREMLKAIKAEPQAALEALLTGQYDKNLTEEDVKTLTSHARATRNARLAEQEWLHKQEVRALAGAREATGNRFVQMLEDGELTSDEIMNSNLEPTGENSKEHWIKMLKQRAKGPTQNGGPMAQKLFHDIYRPEGDPQKITSAAQIERYYYHRDPDQRISYTDMKRLRTEFENSRSGEGAQLGKVKSDLFKRVEPLISPKGMLGQVLSPRGELDMYRFERYVDRKIQQYRDEGKDPFSLLDPNSPDFLGKADTIKAFQSADQAALQSSSEDIRELPTQNGKVTADQLAPGAGYILPGGRVGIWNGRYFEVTGPRGAGSRIPHITNEPEPIETRELP